ncbi:MAG TPA: hypothetical protein IAB83_11035 [Candidatus Faecousia faecavium]|nr:hypothetical protein [Candidatus Faecousia faecavium]
MDSCDYLSDVLDDFDVVADAMGEDFTQALIAQNVGRLPYVLHAYRKLIEAFNRYFSEISATMDDFLKNLTVIFKRKDDLPRPCRFGPRVTKLRRHGIPWYTSGFT